MKNVNVKITCPDGFKVVSTNIIVNAYPGGVHLELLIGFKPKSVLYHPDAINMLPFNPMDMIRMLT